MRNFFILLFVLIISCASIVKEDNRKSEETLRKRASFDMNCNLTKLKLTVLDTYSSGWYKQVGVEGCGKKGVYIQLRAGEWILNSTTK